MNGDTAKRRARQAGLVYVNSFEGGIRRRRRGRGFTYFSVSGRVLSGKRGRRRIERLAIPPAWNDVWICSSSKGHIQATGIDAAGRKQYIYHEHWQELSSVNKYRRLPQVAQLLPRLRRRVRRDLQGRKLVKRRVQAAIVQLLDQTYIRIGNERYARERGSRGATTLKSGQVSVKGVVISLDFPAKSGRRREIEFSDGRVAGVIRQCKEVKGQYLFCYRGESEEYCRIDSTDVNEYLQEISGEPLTAKDFRTWWANVIVLARLQQLEEEAGETRRKQALREAISAAAEALGNTKAVCRKSYVHPGLLDAALAGELPRLLRRSKNRAGFSMLHGNERRLALVLGCLPFS